MVGKPAGYEAFRLETPSGDFAGWAFCPEFRVDPPALRWGGRVFMRTDKKAEYQDAKGGKITKVPVYRESTTIDLTHISSNDLEPWNG